MDTYNLPTAIPEWITNILKQEVCYEKTAFFVCNNAVELASRDRTLLVGHITGEEGDEDEGITRAVLRINEGRQAQQVNMPEGSYQDSVTFLDLPQLDALIDHLQGIRLLMLLNNP